MEFNFDHSDGVKPPAWFVALRRAPPFGWKDAGRVIEKQEGDWRARAGVDERGVWVTVTFVSSLARKETAYFTRLSGVRGAHGQTLREIIKQPEMRIWLRGFESFSAELEPERPGVVKLLVRARASNARGALHVMSFALELADRLDPANRKFSVEGKSRIVEVTRTIVERETAWLSAMVDLTPHAVRAHCTLELGDTSAQGVLEVRPAWLPFYKAHLALRATLPVEFREFRLTRHSGEFWRELTDDDLDIPEDSDLIVDARDEAARAAARVVAQRVHRYINADVYVVLDTLFVTFPIVPGLVLSDALRECTLIWRDLVEHSMGLTGE